MVRKYLLICGLVGIFFASCASEQISIEQASSPNKYLQLGISNLEVRDFEAARKYFEYIIKNFPTEERAIIEANYNICLSLVREKKWAEAKSKLEAYIASLPANEQSGTFGILAKNLIGQCDAVLSPLPKPSETPAPQPNS